MAFNHNSKLADTEPAWGDIDKTRLPLPAFGNMTGADPTAKSSWAYPHHWVEGGGDLDEDGVYTTGTLWLHRGGLAAARSAAGGARSGQPADGEVRDHLDAHPSAEELRDAVEATASALCQEIPADVPEWVMICRTGTWQHPQQPGAVLQITPAHLASALDYFGRHYSGKTDVVIDYHHQSYAAARGVSPKAPAAGWINEMELRASGTQLWGHVLWTVEARKAVADREYRYLSPHLQSGPDRVTGEQVLMRIPDVGLTNTPYMTELEALNENNLAGTDAGGITRPPREPEGTAEGGESMKMLELIASVLGITPEDCASRLGQDAGAEDKVVAEALCAQAAKVKELEAQEPPVVSDAIASTLGLDPKADEKTVKARIIQMQAGGDLGPVRAKLQLAPEASVQDVLATLDGLQETRHRQQAEELVDKAVKDGKVPPAQKDFFLHAAEADLEAVRMALAASPVITALAQHGHRADTGEPTLTADDKHVIKLTGVSEEAYLAAK